MNETKLLQETLNSAPSEIKQIIADKSWEPIVNQITQENTFTEEQKTALENEVLFVLLGMELLSDLSKNIEANVNVQPALASSIATKIHESVFKNIEALLPIESEESEQIHTKEETDRLLPELAPEMHPMIEEGEVAHNVPLPEEREEDTKSKEAPAPVNLPTEEPVTASSMPMHEVKPVTPPVAEPKQEEKVPEPPKSSYPPGQDPYREPVE